MTSAPPKAIKAFVTGTIKNQLFDSNTDFSEHVETPFLALLQLEMAQRGVLVSAKDDDISKWDAAKTLDAVRSSIGKSLLEVGGPLSEPLLATSSVLSARTAELCASVCSKIAAPVVMDVQSALQRCQDVSDPRFHALLELVSKEKEEGGSCLLQVKSLQLMAEGYYLRGASLQPDTPQMWKKALDVILLRQNIKEGEVSPGEAAFVLSNMSRIANSKGNTKRAAELCIRATEGYLQLARSTGPHPEHSTDTKKAVQAFVAPYQTATNEPLSEAQAALSYCKQKLEVLSPSDAFVMKILHVQLQLAEEDSLIEEQSQHQYRQHQNRTDDHKPSKGKGGSAATRSCWKPTSQTTIREMARNQVLADADPKKILQGAAATLRDAFLSQDGNAATQKRAAAALTLVLERSEDRARALMRRKNQSNVGWSELTNFVVPVIHRMAQPTKESLGSMTEEEVTFVDTCATLVPCLQWMNGESRGAISNVQINTVKNVLKSLLDRSMQAKQNYEAASNVLKSSTEAMDVKIRELECAHASMQAWSILLQIWEHSNTAEWKGHTELATALAQKADNYSARYGSSFGNLLVAWSGLSNSSFTYCTAPEARLIWKAAQHNLAAARSEWGRPISNVEQLALDLSKADMECGILAGGFASEAFKAYRSVLNRMETELSSFDNSFQALVKSHCWIGLARIALRRDYDNGGREETNPIDLARKSLEVLTSIRLDRKDQLPLTFISVSSTVCFRHQITVSRQLVAEALVRSGRAHEAKVFLEDAVSESPQDAEAAFSLGAFLLRQAFQSSASTTQSDVDAAKRQLLRSAKLDALKAGPFALLGVWYEDQKDLKRALGCHSKAILLDPSNPVSGRGLIRLTKWDSAKAIVDAAIRTSSAVNGWAWRALGNHNVMVTGENNLGAVALLKCLRCRDIGRPQDEAMSPFFAIAQPLGKRYAEKEKSDGWSELAFCYSRLGRYTAAIRSFYSSIETAGEHVEASVLCACAEAELGLGLVEEAAWNFSKALQLSDTLVQPLAAVGHGKSLLSLAKRATQDGKCGTAYGYIRCAINGFNTATISAGCAQKLRGDLYTFGAALPPDLFVDSSSEPGILAQIAFVAKGEACYRAALDHYAGSSENEDEVNLLQATVVTDTGVNILLRAQLTSFHESKALGFENSNQSASVSNLYERASVEFCRAVKLCPDYAPGFIGIGCSTVLSDPLLAQHAFCRSLQLDGISPDGYANLGVLYTSRKCFDASKGVLDSLTQVADSPRVWINRALMLERNDASSLETGKVSAAQENMSRVADAYRAALQVVQYPIAMSGLALACLASANSRKLGKARQESFGYLQQYWGRMGSFGVTYSLLKGICDLEEGAKEGVGRRVTETSVAEVTRQLQLLWPESGGNGSQALDLDLMQKFVSSADLHTGFDDDIASRFPILSLARQIIHQPYRGDIWVTVAKSLLRGSFASTSVFESAFMASCRAVKILTQQLTSSNNPRMAEEEPQVVDGRDLSEALSLDYWLHNLNEKEKGPTCKTSELQKALMICPSNKFAREAVANALEELKESACA